jgi:hypothetical protein
MHHHSPKPLVLVHFSHCLLHLVLVEVQHQVQLLHSFWTCQGPQSKGQLGHHTATQA